MQLQRSGKTSLITLSCGIKISAVRSFVSSQSMRVMDMRTDKRTDRRTDRRAELRYPRGKSSTVTFHTFGDDDVVTEDIFFSP